MYYKYNSVEFTFKALSMSNEIPFITLPADASY